MTWMRQRLKSSSVALGCFMTNSRIINWASELPSLAIRSINKLRSSMQSVSFALQMLERASLPKETKSFRSKEWTNPRSWCTHSVLFRSSIMRCTCMYINELICIMYDQYNLSAKRKPSVVNLLSSHEFW